MSYIPSFNPPIKYDPTWLRRVLENIRTAVNFTTAQVFRAYMSADMSKAGGTWETLPFNVTSFNTVGTFDAANKRLTPTTPGYYRVTVGGYSPTAGTGVERWAFSVFKNGTADSIGGGGYNQVDCPFSTYTTTLYLSSTDYIYIGMYSAIAVTLRGGTGMYGMYWIVEYLGS